MILDIIYFIVLIIAGYFTFFHLILWFENRDGFTKKKRISSKLPSVSILVPAFNEENVIESSIKNILGINYPKDKMEVMIIDDGSTDNTYKIAKKYENKIKVLKKRNVGKAAALNFGLKHAKNDFIAVVDADTFLDKDALRKCMCYFDGDKTAAVTSHVLVRKNDNFLEKLQNVELMIIALIRKLKESLNLVDATPGPLSVYRKNVLKNLGGFDEKNLVEDVEIAWRILRNGYKIRMAFDAMVYSFYPSSISKWWKQRTRWSIGGIQTMRKHLDCISDKNAHTVRTFLFPTSIIGYIVPIMGVILFSYLILNASLYIFKSFYMGTMPYMGIDLINSIDVFSAIIIVIFLSALWLVKICLSNEKNRPNLKTILLFLSVYIFLLPAVLIYGIYRYLRKERGWLTK